MKYMLLIHQGDAPTPRSPEAWATLSEDEQQQRLRRLPRRSTRRRASRPGTAWSLPETATTVRVQDGKTLTTDGPFVEIKEVDRRLPHLRGRRPRRRDRAGRADPGRPPRRRDRGASHRWSGSDLEQAFREEWGRVLAALIGFLGDFDLAEEAAQEAFAIAAERWPRDGAPSNPRAWLMTTARNRAIDRIRRDRTLAAKTRPAPGARGGGGHRWTRRRSPTSGSSSSSPAVTRRSPSRRRWRSRCARSAASPPTRSPARSWCPSRRWRSGWCGPSARSRPPGSRSACRPTTCCPIGSTPCSRSST